MKATGMLLAILLLGGCASLSPKWDHGLQGLSEDEGRLCQAVLQASFELIEGSPGPIYIRVLGRDPDEFFLDGLPYSQAPVLPASDYQPGRGHLLDVVDLQHTGEDTATVAVEDYQDPLQARRLIYRMARRGGEWRMVDRAVVDEVEGATS